ncbi:MAG: hypothetical protein HUJ91_03630 [Bacteroidales bacterium]|nr:hypothetical protein [Bacteroidales bacterium]
MKKLFSVVILLTAALWNAGAQDLEITAGVDNMSSYLWRGMKIAPQDGKSASLISMPELSAAYTVGDFSFELGGCYYQQWAKEGYTETDLWGGVYYGNFGLTLTSYLNDMTEAALSYTLSENIPLTFTWNLGIAGPSDLKFDGKRNWSSYIELSYPYEFDFGLTLDAAVGAVPYSSIYYGTDKGFKLFNLSLAAGYEIALGESFSIPLKANYMYNPAWGEGFFAASAGLYYTFSL